MIRDRGPRASRDCGASRRGGVEVYADGDGEGYVVALEADDGRAVVS